jgi:AcrR family transcriptional regulator
VARNSNERSKAAPAPAFEAKAASRAERKATETRRAILRAAARAFRTSGFAATGMREIADAAGLSTANLYYYFASKVELLYFCQDHSLDRMLEALDAARRGGLDEDDDLAERVRALIRTHLLCTLDELDGAAAHLEVDALPDEMRERVVAKRDRYERGLRRLVAAGARAGRFAPCDPTLVTRAILGALNWTARWFRPDGPRSPAAVADAFADYLLRGLLPWNGNGPRSPSRSTAKASRSASPRTRRSSRS